MCWEVVPWRYRVPDLRWITSALLRCQTRAHGARVTRRDSCGAAMAAHEPTRTCDDADERGSRSCGTAALTPSVLRRMSRRCPSYRLERCDVRRAVRTQCTQARLTARSEGKGSLSSPAVVVASFSLPLPSATSFAVRRGVHLTGACFARALRSATSPIRMRFCAARAAMARRHMHRRRGLLLTLVRALSISHR